jgi:23S rRNA pseudouridine1911/1915/1917 synthase
VTDPAETLREEVPAALAGERVDRAVAMLIGCSRAEAADLVAAGGVRVRGKAAKSRSQKLHEGDLLEIDGIDRPPPQALVPDPDVPLDVVHEDADVLVVDKAPGIVVHPGAGGEQGTLVHGLLARYPDIATVGEIDRPGIVHRLDAGTSGLLAVARTPEAYDSLTAQLAARDVERRYDTLVWGHPEADQGVVDAPIGRSERRRTNMAVTADGREARTHYEVVQRYSKPVPLALLRCRLETGRTHQIRVHMQAIGHAVVGDDRYRGVRPAVDAPRPLLHAGRLGFAHPRGGEHVRFDAGIPADFAEVLAGLTEEPRADG